MKPEENNINAGHTGTRNTLRVIGPAVLLVGIAFMAVGFISFFSSMTSMNMGPPKFFWCLFVGMPLTAIGGAISKFAFIGSVLRYMSAEAAPVGKDTFNYMASGTKDGVRDVFSAVREGLTGEAANEIACPHCSHENEVDAKYCDQCGGDIAAEIHCPACSKSNEVDAKFCNGCGVSMAK